MQVPNFLAWEEDITGIPGYNLHIDAVQWFWDSIMALPSKTQSNLLLLQSDVPEVAPHLMAWMQDPPNFILLSTGTSSITDVAAQCEVAFAAPPPQGVDEAMMAELVKAADRGCPFWETLAEPKRQQQQAQMEHRLRLSAIQLHRIKVCEQTARQRQEEQQKKAAASEGAVEPESQPKAPEARGSDTSGPRQ